METLKQKVYAAIREKDFMAKGVCLLLAVILWALIINGKTAVERHRIPIVVNNLPAYLLISDMPEKYALIEIEGTKDQLKSFNLKNVRALVSLDKAVVGGPARYEITLEKNQVPEDVAVSLVRGDVEITVEKKEERWIRVRPSVTGTVRKGKVILDKQVIPERVKIAGPKSVVAGIESVETEDVSVESAAANIQRQVGLKRDENAGVTFGETIFIVKVTIADLKDLIPLTVPVAVINPAGEYEYELRDPEVQIYVRPKSGAVVTPEDIDAYVDAAKINMSQAIGDYPGEPVYRDLPVIVDSKLVGPGDIVSIMPKRALLRITRKEKAGEE
ncbi:MAG: YbbR-like domain-containing protein [Spirochaetes bacterium]|nr:YbbR-like domain-containing protein [Spirochaetota bacterium]